jgi:replication-associated recombination protein RarA
MATESRDPWVDVKTRHGLAADQVISALQKEIRRGNVENAALLAYEMATTSPELESYMWYRLLVISVEDIGWGEPQAPVLIRTLYEINQTFGHRGGENLLLAVHAVRYLCSCQKDRSSDEMVNLLIHQVEHEQRIPEIPDYALDMHTAQGQAMGRGKLHFWEVASQIAPELPDRDTSYKERMLSILKALEPET